MTEFPRDALNELETWTRASHGSWWRSWGDPGDAELADLVATACRVVVPWVGAAPGNACAVRFDRLVSRIPGPRAALALYLAVRARVDHGSSVARVSLEDLAEALCMPPTLIRRLNRLTVEPREHLAASA